MSITRRDLLRNLAGLTALTWGATGCSSEGGEALGQPATTPDGGKGDGGSGDVPPLDDVPPPDTETSKRVFQHAVARGDGPSPPAAPG